ncbi:uncharacterized protein VTP21DRAFT_6066 [Calcarisporiella thermophila]|uniref:uncharacterized protein n=1 Tax=Calcarisporiella thermophila TaxID=911321 RepID=UPI003743E0BF
MFFASISEALPYFILFIAVLYFILFEYPDWRSKRSLGHSTYAKTRINKDEIQLSNAILFPILLPISIFYFIFILTINTLRLIIFITLDTVEISSKLAFSKGLEVAKEIRRSFPRWFSRIVLKNMSRVMRDWAGPFFAIAIKEIHHGAEFIGNEWDSLCEWWEHKGRDKAAAILVPTLESFFVACHTLLVKPVQWILPRFTMLFKILVRGGIVLIVDILEDLWSILTILYTCGKTLHSYLVEPFISTVWGIGNWLKPYAIGWLKYSANGVLLGATWTGHASIIIIEQLTPMMQQYWRQAVSLFLFEMSSGVWNFSLFVLALSQIIWKAGQICVKMIKWIWDTCIVMSRLSVVICSHAQDIATRSFTTISASFSPLIAIASSLAHQMSPYIFGFINASCQFICNPLMLATRRMISLITALIMVVNPYIQSLLIWGGNWTAFLLFNLYSSIHALVSWAAFNSYRIVCNYISTLASVLPPFILALDSAKNWWIYAQPHIIQKGKFLVLQVDEGIAWIADEVVGWEKRIRLERKR